jgi:aspartyl-tRNA(Asn)/glutamyl-tRNA(Gln) amidotransferase subunit A
MKKLRDISWHRLWDAPERLATYTERVEQKNGEIRAFLEFDPVRKSGHTGLQVKDHQAAGTGASSPSGAVSALAGIPFAVKDNIAVEGFGLSCASKSLEGLKSPYTAGAVARLTAAGARVVGKTNLDEFGMGSSTENSAYGKTLNPWDTTKTPGGSSGGSAAAVAAGMVPFALGSDTGGSVRQPASFCGVYGLKPSYGAVSRYGLVAYASSLEGIGVLSADIDLAEAVFETMRGEDPMDQTSVETGQDEETMSSRPVVGILEEIEGLSPQIEEGYRKSIETLKELGFTIRPVSLPSLDYVIPAYYTIASAEAGANLARYTGIRYGYRNEDAEDPKEMVESSRDESFGAEVKLRILLGTYVLRSGFQEQYYVKAQKIRTAIRNDFTTIFSQADLLMMPVFPSQAFSFGEAGLDPFQQKLADKFTATANLAGTPALAFPVGIADGLPVGMQFLAPMFREKRLFAAARRYAEAFSPRLPDTALDWRFLDD